MFSDHFGKILTYNYRNEHLVGKQIMFMVFFKALWAFLIEFFSSDKIIFLFKKIVSSKNVKNLCNLTFFKCVPRVPKQMPANKIKFK